MTLQIGDTAPDFEYSTTTLHETKGKKIVFFYPKAFTAGCTREVKSIQSSYDIIRENGYTVIGLSMDSGEKQAKFAESCEVEYELVSDRKGKVAKAYGVKFWFSILAVAKRVTFIVNEENEIIHIWDLGLSGQKTLLGLKSYGEELIEKLGIKNDN